MFRGEHAAKLGLSVQELEMLEEFKEKLFHKESLPATGTGHPKVASSIERNQRKLGELARLESQLEEKQEELDRMWQKLQKSRQEAMLLKGEKEELTEKLSTFSGSESDMQAENAKLRKALKEMVGATALESIAGVKGEKENVAGVNSSQQSHPATTLPSSGGSGMSGTID